MAVLPVFAFGTTPVPTTFPASSSTARAAYGLLRMRSRLRLRSQMSDPINSTLASVEAAYQPCARRRAVAPSYRNRCACRSR
jgi:hypothetical protein